MVFGVTSIVENPKQGRQMGAENVQGWIDLPVFPEQWPQLLSGRAKWVMRPGLGESTCAKPMLIT